jgi:excinuclease ABC subunit A
LAPIVRGRKGHYRELFEEIRKKGFVRARIDGVITELVPKLQLDRYKIHDIEVVVDRLPVTEAMKTRLALSVQQSMQMGKGLMFIMLNDSGEVVQFSKQLMCVDTGLSYEEPSPNAFSFNSPYGACPVCRGLGTTHSVDLDTIIPDKSKSLNQGAVVPLGEERDAYLFKQAKSVCRKHKINMNVPVADLTETELNIILYGNPSAGETAVDLNQDTKAGYYSSSFEGVVNMIKRWYGAPNSSDNMRQWTEKYMIETVCPECNGTRLKKESLWFKVNDKNIAELSSMNLDVLYQWFNHIEKKLSSKQNAIAHDVLKEIRERIQFLLNVGLDYLTLSRPSGTLSGGEYQRIRLATQIGSQLQGITYILDEPSIGLHQRDNQKLIQALTNLRDIGNSVLVVEHDRDIMMAADYLVDIGPGAGNLGGKIVAAGTPKEILRSDSDTARFLKREKNISVPDTRRKGNGHIISLTGATGNNLKNVQIDIPLGQLILVTGVSGSGKSTLINETLYPILSNHCYPASRKTPMTYTAITGLEHIDKVIEIDQSPIGRTPRSNPATYCGFFTDIRTLFANVPESKIRGYQAGRFSFNVKSGRCDVCEGGGMRVIEMNFLPDVYVHCEKCNGKRYNRETLEIRYKGLSISDVLNLTVNEAVTFFNAVPSIYRKIKVLQEVGLGYITLGQSAVTLSGGEAQRVKLSTELGLRDTGRTFYILDEPTTGLHFQDVQHLLNVLNKLVERGNTVLVIEHNMDMIKVADYIIDIGPEGGSGGGNVLFQGTPEALVKVKESYTARFLKEELQFR